MDQRSKRAETIKILEENIGINICDRGLGNGFLDMTKAQTTTKKTQINWTSSRLKILCFNGHY